MDNFPARSPSEKVGGIVYFGRMLDRFARTLAVNYPPITSGTWDVGSMNPAYRSCTSGMQASSRW